MLAPVPSPPSDPVADELRALRQSIDALAQRVEQLAADNQRLREQLAFSQAARSDLTAQAEHLISMLADSRNEIRALKGGAES